MKKQAERLPVLLAAVGVGVILIASGVAVRSGQANNGVQAAMNATFTAEVVLSPTETIEATPTLTETVAPTETPGLPTPTLRDPGGTLTAEAASQPVPTQDLTTPEPTPVPERKINTGNFATPSVPVPTDVPPPATPLDQNGNVRNILLIGRSERAISSNSRSADGENLQDFSTDTIIIVSVNVKEQTVNMLSLPRDLQVYVPGWTVTKINQVYAHGELVEWQGGGFGLLQETLMYNFGIYVGHYAMVNLEGFKDIVDVLGGIEVPVDCQIQYYGLKEPRLEREDFSTDQAWIAYTAPESGNWELVTIPVGVASMDGYEALTYSRFRTGSTDFDRAVRQQQVLRAIAATARDGGFTNLTRLPALWQQYNRLVKTSMEIGNLLELARIGTDMEGIQMTSYTLAGDAYLDSWQHPTLGQTAYFPTEQGYRFVTQAMNPPSRNYVLSNTVSVEVRNGTGTPRLDEVAADRLVWTGIKAVPTGFADAQTYQDTVIYDFTGREKTSQLLSMQQLLRVNNAEVISQPDPNRVVDYVVILGNDYQSCRRNAQQPISPLVTPTPSPSAEVPTSTPTP